MKKRILYVIIILIVGLIVYRVVTRKPGPGGPGGPGGPPGGGPPGGGPGGPPGMGMEVENTIPVKATSVIRADLIDSMNYTGDIVGTEVVNVFSQVSGKIKEIRIKEGNKVSKGQTLFKIDRDIVGMEYMPAIVESPIYGFVGSVSVDIGMTINVSTPLAQIVNQNDVEAVLYVIEENINKVSTGMTAEITVPAFPGKIFYGKVYKKSAVVNPISRTLEVHVLIDNKNLLLKHGMYANVKLIIDKKRNVLVVPIDSVMFSEKDNNAYVMTVSSDKAVKKNIIVGISTDEYTEIVSGLSTNDVVITLGKENVEEGNKLLVYREDTENKSSKVDLQELNK